MNDIFYLLKENINARNICDALEGNEKKISVNAEESAFTVDYLDGIHMEWYKMNIEDFEDFDYLKKNKFLIVYCISHHSKDINTIISEIKILMKKFGGIVGNDNEKFKPLFEYNEIDNFSYEKNDIES